MSVAAYDTLKKLSLARLNDQDAYWSIDTAPSMGFLHRAKFSTVLNEGREFYSENLSSNEYDKKLANALGIRAARFTVISFAYFDGSDTIKALPMYASKEKRSEVTITGSRHIAIVNDYWEYAHEHGIRRDSFMPARGGDVFDGECVLREGYIGPVSYLNVHQESDLSQEKINAMEDMTHQFSGTSYVVTMGTEVLACFDAK